MGISPRPLFSYRFRIPHRMRPKPPRARRLGKILFVILLAAVVIVAGQQIRKGGLLQRLVSGPPEVRDLRPLALRIDETLRAALEDLGASPSISLQNEMVMEERGGTWLFRQLTIRVSHQISLSRCNLAISQAVQEIGGQILSVEQGTGGDRLTMELGAEGFRTHLVELIADQDIAPTLGRLALIIDDFGAINSPVADAFIQLPITLNVAVIPGHPTSQRIARQAAAAGHQVFVHLPMEPKEGELGEKNGILVDLPEDEIRRRVRWALSEIPQAAGVNNHMGSRATENEKVMRVVLEEITAAGKFFVDSRTSARSVALDVGQNLNMPCDKSDGFLDYQEGQAEATKRLQVLADLALKYGSAIGIGHVKANTLESLERMIPQLERKGVRFVSASRVLQARRRM